MRLFCLSLLCGLIACGCAQTKTANRTGARAGSQTGVAAPWAGGSTNSALLVTPGRQISGRLTSVNMQSKFVIATFPLGTIPLPNQLLGVYRNGLKVGVIKMTGQQLDINFVGDIVQGDCQLGDEAKSD